MRAVLAMDVVVPLVAVALAATLPLEVPVKIALVTLSLAPLPPTFSGKPLKAGGKISYTVGLFVAITFIAVFFIPLALTLLTRVFGIPLQMEPSAIWALVVWSLLVPLASGLVIHQLAPAFADRIAYAVARTGTMVLLVGFAAILARAWPAMISLVGNGTILAMIVLAIVAMAAGHLLGGPDPEDRATLALASAGRHPAIAIAIAQTNFPDQKLASAAVLLYLLVCGMATAPYLKWVAHRRIDQSPIKS